MDEALEARLHGQEFVYGMAHTVFSGEPDEALMGALGSSVCIDSLRGLGDSDPGWQELTAWCEVAAGEGAAPGASSNLLATTRSEFNRAIAGLVANRQSHPWESVYTSSKKLLFQPEMLEVRAFYRAYDCLPRLYPRVADDHLSLECAFLAHLAKRALEARDDEERAFCLAGQRSFLQEHLLVWLGSYASELHEDAPDGLYDLMARALLAFAEGEKRFLDEILRRAA